MAQTQEHVKLIDLSDVILKNQKITELLQKVSALKEELAECGLKLNEEIKVDEQKYNAYFGL